MGSNIIYDINPDTGLMRLKFKKNLLDSLNSDNREAFEKYLLPLLAMNEKFVLTGSLSLKLLGFEPLDKVGDFDIGLTSAFTEEEFITVKNFFGFYTSYGERYGHEPDKKEFDPNAHLWQFGKHWEVSVDDTYNRTAEIKIDIFNDEMLRKKDIIEVWYDDFEVRLVHPSITLSYRMRYALDIRSSSTYKYWERMKKFMDDAKSYYHHVRKVSKMIERVYEHNWNIEDDKEKINRIRNLIVNREANADMFFDKAFKDIISGEIQIT